MAYQLNIDNKQAYEWLKKLINNTIESPQSRPYQTAYDELVIWKNAFDECDKLREQAAEERKQERASKQSSSTRSSSARKRSVRVKQSSEFDCSNHPTYGGMRVPRTDCKKCWSIYKKLHPMEYDRAFRKFKLKQKQNDNK